MLSRIDRQVDPWNGKFGDAYHERNQATGHEVLNREKMWYEVLNHMPQRRMDILEIGAGLGANLKAIDHICEGADYRHGLHGLETNDLARGHLAENFPVISGAAEAIGATDKSFDLVFTYGVLIHMTDPLPGMREMYRVSRRFIMCAEYFAPGRETIPYRNGVPLFRNDYGSLWLDNFDVTPIGYGFCWKRTTGLDNVTWWLFERKDLEVMTPEEQQRYLAMTAG